MNQFPVDGFSVSWLSQLLYMKPDFKKKHVYSTVYPPWN